MGTLPSRNFSWGFLGAMERSGADAHGAWDAASIVIASTTRAKPDAVRAFLDSRLGRHFADDVLDSLAAGRVLEDAVEAVAERWMALCISRQTSRETGAPEGLPYLAGMVEAAAIGVEA